MKKTGLLFVLALLWSDYARRKLPTFRVKRSASSSAIQPAAPTTYGGGYRDTYQQVYSRESSHRCAEHARRRLDDRDQLRL